MGACGLERQIRAVGRALQPYTTGLIGGGEVLLGGEATLARGETYTTPWLYGSYGDGLNEVAARFHDYVRSCHPDLAVKPRPVILNTWEAVYFDHDYDTLKALADKAGDSGVERFVVDDGWFGSRRDSTSGLGDWQIAQDVWPDGPEEPQGARRLRARERHGVRPVVELEMVNPDSDVARAHPDWVLRPTANRLPMQGRSQQVLDLTNPDAYRYIHDSIDALVGELGIDYIKWDHNKFVTEAVSPRTGRPAVHGQTLAVYRMFRDLEVAHPGLEIESCASGGGRIDLGILEFASRVWTSDCVDPVERADIQRYTSLLVPPCMDGRACGGESCTFHASRHEPGDAHGDGVLRAHGRRMESAQGVGRGVEKARRMGRRIQEAPRMVRDRHVRARRYRRSGRPGRRHGQAGSFRGVLPVHATDNVQTLPAAPIRVPGLDPDGTYRIQPLWLDLDLDGLGLGSGQSPLGWWTKDGVLMTGRALMTYGLRPPSLHPAQSVLFTAIRQ